MSKIALYNGIKQTLADVSYTGSDNSVHKIETIALWRNQIEREKEDTPFKYPAVFIEFLTSNYMESSSKVYQTLDMTVRLHICFKSYKDEDTDILFLTQEIYSALQLKQFGFFGVLKRRNEEQNFDHPSIQDFIQDYLVTQAKDYGADKRPTVDATVTPVIFVESEPTPPPFTHENMVTEDNQELLCETGENIVIY